ncbi:MAG TPA: hypothetical protein VFS39_05925 [Nitrospira sp.]|nr:hypothetical protein [Nitrospira sp.]
MESLSAVVSFIKDQRDVITGLRQIAVMSGQILGDGTELDAVMDITGVDAVEQGDAELEAWAARGRSDLFERVFRRRVQFTIHAQEDAA